MSASEPTRTTVPSSADAGFSLVVMVALILPLLMLIGASITLLSGRNRELLASVSSTRALFAAESGLDAALFAARTGSLQNRVRLERDLGSGLSYSVMPEFLGSDGIDNDGDGRIDDAREAVFELIIIGRHARSLRTIAAYIGRLMAMPPILGSLTLQNIKGTEQHLVTCDETSFISGWENGNPSSGSGAPGLVIPMGMTGYVTSEFGSLETPRQIDGTAPTANPNIQEFPLTFDLEKFADSVRNAADMILVSGWDNADLGDATKNDFRLIYGEGKLFFQSGGRGAGLMVVRGELRLSRSFHFDGIIICLGKMRIQKNSTVVGAVYVATLEDGVTHTAENMRIRLTNHSRLFYSKSMVDRVRLGVPLGRYVSHNGWQEISKKTAGL